MKKLPFPCNKVLLFTGALFVLIIGSSYNSFNTSWQYDDYVNIVHNEAVHPSDNSWEQISKSLDSIYAHQIFSRPLAYLSFALNYRLGRLQVPGYHAVNLIIHCIAAIFLFLFIRGTLRLPVLQGRYARHAEWIAWIAAAFWSLHPIQVSAVTYIVQRMTSMAGMFYIAGLFFFLRGRTSNHSGKKVAAYAGCVFCGFCALLTKENSILLIYSLLLYDLIFFSRLDRKALRDRFAWAIGLTLAAGLLSLLFIKPDMIFNSYDNRPFTMIQRLMTQPRVLLIYLSLIALPMTSRLSILHDVQASKSLVDPWTTWVAILSLLAVIGSLGMLSRRHRLFGFCGLFFFLNHLVEASFLNLELIYEHRNYVPSMLLFVPVAVAVIRSLTFFSYRRPLQYMISGSIALLLISNMHTTLGYNQIFETGLNTWIHVVEHSPNLSLAHINLGELYWEMGLHEKSRQENQMAFQLDRYNDLRQKWSIYYNLGLYSAYEQHDYVSAIAHFNTAKKYNPSYRPIWYEQARSWMMGGQLVHAVNVLDEAISQWPNQSELLALKGIIALKQKQFDKAVHLGQQALMINEQNQEAMMVTAEAYRGMGQTRIAVEKWKSVLNYNPDHVLAIMALIELYSELEQPCAVTEYVCRLLKMTGKSHHGKGINIRVENEAILPYVPQTEKITRILMAVQKDTKPVCINEK